VEDYANLPFLNGDGLVEGLAEVLVQLKTDWLSILDLPFMLYIKKAVEAEAFFEYWLS
jgi:hypothetical protein